MRRFDTGHITRVARLGDADSCKTALGINLGLESRDSGHRILGLHTRLYLLVAPKKLGTVDRAASIRCAEHDNVKFGG